MLSPELLCVETYPGSTAYRWWSLNIRLTQEGRGCGLRMLGPLDVAAQSHSFVNAYRGEEAFSTLADVPPDRSVL